MSTYEQELLASLSARDPGGQGFRVEPDAMKYIVLLQRGFPFKGSKIDWDQVPGTISRFANATDSDAYRAATLELVANARQSGELEDETPVTVIGDSHLEVAIECTLGQFIEAIDDFLAIPQHTYVLGKDAAWCMALTMEGHLDFGRKPGPRGDGH